LTINISKIMQAINRWYARWYNEYHKIKGHFWEDRFYAELIKDDQQLLAVMRYIDLNPVRAKLCNHPADWKHSGAGFYLNGAENSLIDVPDTYMALGDDWQERRKTYASIFPFNLANLTRLE
ncbi:MAG: transposase, partial [Candidatus Omnitrophica bacterium]|nr:transposase [Candidatus Omnitrophota bacterium]